MLMGAAVRSVQTAGALRDDPAIERRLRQRARRLRAARSANSRPCSRTSRGLPAKRPPRLPPPARRPMLWRTADVIDDAVFLEAASAKIRCAEAAEEGAAIAHQVFGAIGFTKEHVLHRFTLRMLGWRDDFGNESYWAAELGRRDRAARRRRILAAGGVAMSDGPAIRSDPPAAANAKRCAHDVRAFLAEEIAAGTFDPHRPGHGDSHNPRFQPPRRRQGLDRHDLAEEIRRPASARFSSAMS